MTYAFTFSRRATLLALGLFFGATAQAAPPQTIRIGVATAGGGGNVGLMGVIADEVLRLGGEVTGVIPTALVEREVGHTGLTRQFVVKDMHERKRSGGLAQRSFVISQSRTGRLRARPARLPDHGRAGEITELE